MINFKQIKKDDDSKTDRYLITYADLITLLLGLFVILYASSSVDSEKYKELRGAMSKMFSSSGIIPNGGSGVLDGSKGLSPLESYPTDEVKTLDDIFREASEVLKEYIQRGTLKIVQDESGIVVTFPEKLLFNSGKADVQTKGRQLLDTLAGVFKGIPYQLTIDGHTDSVPIRGGAFPSNWHLSVARAMNAAYSLIQNGTPEYNLVVRGFGSQRPVNDNNSSDHRAENRRVEITISELPKEAASADGYSDSEKSESDENE